jgi:serine/threonine-protein kinase PpkA
MDISGYKIKKKIGKGAMATVFLADQLSLGRQVALKILAPALACQRDFTARFLNEGRIVAYLNHPQIVSVYNLGSHDHYYYLAMEFLPGGTLEQRIKAGMSPARTLRLITTICRALSFAHRHGVIHRDIKPQNILFRNDNTPVLTDFGIARLMNSDPGLTIPGRTVGSPHYMSPEQICGTTIDERSDLYALGILFYKMLTKQLPYQSDQFTEIALMHKTAPIPVLSEKLSLFQPLMNKLLAKRPDDRYANAREFIDALEQIEARHPFSATGTHRLDFTGNQIRRLDGGKLHSLRERNDSADDVTQPAVEPVAGEPDKGRIVRSQSAGAPQPDEHSRPMSPGASFRKKSKFGWKKMWTAAGVALAVACGIYGYPYFKVPLWGFTPSPPGHGDVSLDPKGYGDREPGQSTRQVSPVPPSDEMPLMTQDPAGSRKNLAQTIAGLMAKAERQLADYNLSAPAGDNCYETYREIILLDPSNQAAESLLVKIGVAYHKLAKADQARGQIQNSLVNVGKGLMLVPQDKALLDLQAELKSQLARQTERLRQQARLIERQKKMQAAQQAAVKRQQQAESESAIDDTQDAEPARQTTPRVEPETEKVPQVKTEMEQPEATQKEPVRRNRIFGTF